MVLSFSVLDAQKDEDHDEVEEDDNRVDRPEFFALHHRMPHPTNELPEFDHSVPTARTRRWLRVRMGEKDRTPSPRLGEGRYGEGVLLLAMRSRASTTLAHHARFAG